jgi:hypothetical protein
MASELRVNTLKDASGNNSIATSFVAGGSAKAWADYTTAASFVLNASLNVSSLTDEGAGDCTINIASAMSSANYSVTSNVLGGLSGGTKIFQNGAKAAGTYKQISTNSSGTAGDIGNSYATIHGDLA